MDSNPTVGSTSKYLDSKLQEVELLSELPWQKPSCLIDDRNGGMICLHTSSCLHVMRSDAIRNESQPLNLVDSYSHLLQEVILNDYNGLDP